MDCRLVFIVGACSALDSHMRKHAILCLSMVRKICTACAPTLAAEFCEMVASFRDGAWGKSRSGLICCRE